MIKRLEKQALISDLAALKGLLSEIPEDDYIGRLSIENREASLQRELSNLEDVQTNLAQVAIYFAGGPVEGSHSIQSSFASNMLNIYQELVSKELATAETGGLAERGPVPSKDASALNITSVVHGSFGFVLEEGGNSTLAMLKSGLKEALEATNITIEKFSGENVTPFNQLIDQIDPRLFSTVKRLFEILYQDKALCRIVEDDKEIVLDEISVLRGYDRSQHTDIEEVEVVIIGTLIGVVPYGKRFEFRPVDSQEIIKGSIGPSFGSEYLKMLDSDKQLIGKRWKARLIKKEIERPGSVRSTKFTLVDLVPEEL